MNTLKRLFPGLSALFILLVACSISSRQVVATVPPVQTALTVGPAIVPTTAATAEPAADTIPAGVRPLDLTDEGAARPLPENILGASVEAMIEPILDDPQKIAAIHQTAPGVIRFPGGSQSNYRIRDVKAPPFMAGDETSPAAGGSRRVENPTLTFQNTSSIRCAHGEIPDIRHTDPCGCNPGAQPGDLLGE